MSSLQNIQMPEPLLFTMIQAHYDGMPQMEINHQEVDGKQTRQNSVFNFTIDRMIKSSISVTFSPEHVLRHSKPGRKFDVFEYQAYSDPKLCFRMSKGIHSTKEWQG